MPHVNELLDWTHAAGEVPARGLEVRRVATGAECAALSAANAPAVFTAFAARYHLRPLAKGRFALEGEITATVEQTCVVSLDAMTSELREAVRMELWPEEQVADPPLTASMDVDVDHAIADELDVEPFGVDGRLPVGRVLAEAATLALDPYPRRPGAVLDEAVERAEQRQA